MHFVKAMHAGGRFLRNAAPSFAISCQRYGFSRWISSNRSLITCSSCSPILFCPIAALFELITFVDQQRRVTAVVHYELRTFPVGCEMPDKSTTNILEATRLSTRTPAHRPSRLPLRRDLALKKYYTRPSAH